MGGEGYFSNNLAAKKNEKNDDECSQLKAKQLSLLRKFRRTNNSADFDRYKIAKVLYKSICKQKKNLYKQRLKSQMEENITDSKKFWGTVKSVLRSSCGDQSHTSLNMDDWVNHFKSVFEPDEDDNDTDRALRELNEDNDVEDLYKSDDDSNNGNADDLNRPVHMDEARGGSFTKIVRGCACRTSKI